MTERRSRGYGGGVRRFAVLAAVGLITVFAWAEWESWRASRTGYDAPAPQGGRRVVIVLGYGNRGERANFINRWRVHAGLRTLAGERGERLLILSGGPVHSDRPEAQILAAEARRRGYRGPMLVETNSRSTVQNIENTIPLLRTDDRISIVSDPVHAVRARALLRARRPDLAARLVVGREYRFGERPAEKLVGAIRSKAAGRPTG
ncbi:YdcF family protein [Microbacterium gorillae]|uniref:YdcF family protein n=1 Tax=Microbacterium gorillae TaxID=1231063 RepID=UPI0005917E70|nr:YdcF family protein [Microbacterium gorillae]